MPAKSAKRNQRGSRYFVLYTAVLIVIIVALFVLNQMSQKSPETSQTLIGAPPTASQPIIGNPEAKVSIVEFGDYKCPACKAWASGVWLQLKQDYIDTGKAAFSYINTLFHGEESRLGALAAEAMLLEHPDRFWDFHKALFEEQPGHDHDSLWITQDKVLEIAKAVVPELDEAAFLDSLSSEQTASLVALDELLVNQAGIRLTPTIVVNNIVIADPFDYAEIQAAIEQSLQ